MNKKKCLIKNVFHENAWIAEKFDTLLSTGKNVKIGEIPYQVNIYY